MSLQYHRYRSEVWILVSGIGIAVVDGDERQVTIGDVVEIPIGSQHRMLNPSSNSLVFIEVQQGSSLDESDIVRIEDDFGRQ